MTSDGAGRHLLRRAPLLVVLLLLAWLLLGERPRTVVLVYDLPDADPPARVEVRLAAPDGTTAGGIAWGTDAGPAADRQEHRALLAPGTYRLVAGLRWADGHRREVVRDLPIGREDERIVVHLPGR